MKPGPNRLSTIARVEAAIRRRGTKAFTASEIGRELSLTRQTVYIAIRYLIENGHRIEGAPRLGFMARMKEYA